MALSPMMQQYHDAKQAAGDAILLFRMGDFYELFHEDAKTAARELGLSLTSRDKGENPIPMAGFPHHQLDQYLAKLIARGFRAGSPIRRSRVASLCCTRAACCHGRILDRQQSGMLSERPNPLPQGDAPLLRGGLRKPFDGSS